MKIDYTIIIGVIVIVMLIAVLVMLPPAAKPAHKEENSSQDTNGSEEPWVVMMGIFADQESYRESSRAEFTIRLTVPESMPSAEIRLYGVENRYGAYKIDRNEIFDLAAGENILRIDAQLPPCSSCAGITPGNYSVYSALYSNGTQVANSSMEIELVK